MELIERDVKSYGDLSVDDQRKYCVMPGKSGQHWNFRKIRNNREVQGWKVFAVARDPLERSMSEFFYQIRTRPNLRKHNCYRRGDFSMAMERGFIFKNGWPWHGMSQKKMLLEAEKPTLLRFDHMDKDLATFLKDQTGKEVMPPKRNVNRNDYGKVEVTQEAIDVLMERWGEDYEFLNLQPPTPRLFKARQGVSNSQVTPKKFI